MKHLLACLLALLVATSSVLAKGSGWKEHYDKAVVATFYAGTVLNGYHELTLAQAYVDSAQAELDAMAVPDSVGLAAVADLRNELSISEEIAVDNLNYIYPAFSVFTTEHLEYNIVDDPAELLLEALTEKVIELQDPLFKGTVNENGEYVIVQVTPFDAMHVNVLLDFMSLNTPAYAIRLHEYANFLDPAGIERYQEGTMTTADLEAACDYYGVTRILILRLRDNGSIIPDAENPTVFYKGVTLEAFRSGDEAVKDYFYFETFRIDKATGWYRGVITLVLGALILLVALLLMGGAYKKENRWQWEATRVLRVEEVKRSIVVLAMSISGAYFAHLVGGWWAPGPNAFFGEIHSRAWLAYTAFAPFLFAVVQSYVALFKLANGKMDDAGNFARMIMGGLVAHLVYMDYFEEFAPVMADSMVGSPAWLAPFLFLLPSLCMGDVWERLKIQQLMGGIRWGAFTVTLLASVFVLFADFRHELLWMWTGVGLAQFGSLMLLVVIPLIKRGRTLLGAGEETEFSLVNPVQFVEPGTNLAAARAAVGAFVKPDYDPHEVGYTKALPPLLMVVHGEQGMGKTRLLHEWKEKEDVDFYYGDFNEDLEGAAAMYNPFKEAFEGDGKLVEGKAYFEDRSEMGRKLTGLVAKAAGSSVPLDLESLLAADGDQHTVDEISQDLTERLVAKAEAGRTQLVVIDHYDWVETDPASHNLMKAMLERLMRESQHVERLRIILITDKVDPQAFPPELQDLQEKTCELRETTCRVEWSGEAARTAFVERVCSREGLAVEVADEAYRLTPSLVTHLRSKCLDNGPEFTPGDFFAYLDGLREKEFLKIQGDRIDLKGNPAAAGLSLARGKVDAVKQRFQQLEDADRRLLGAAAHIGFKFDAEILAGIWEEDVLNIIAQLVRLEELRFVRDLDKEDNVYSFSDRESHGAIKESGKGGGERFMQLLVEYQKRTVGLMRKGGDAYVHSLDPEILGNAADHCLDAHFSGIPMIRKQAPYILLHAGMAAMRYGRGDRAVKWFSALVDRGMNWVSCDANEGHHALAPAALMGSFLTVAIETGSDGLTPFDAYEDQTAGRLDALLARLDEVDDQGMRERILLALQRDVQRRKPRQAGKNAELDALWDRRRKAIKSAYQWLEVQEHPLRFEFYELLMDRAGTDLLLPLLKSVEAQPEGAGQRQLKGEVLRHLALITKGPDRGLHARAALQLEAEESGLRHVPKALESWSDTLALLDALMAHGWRSTNLNMTCSRLREAAYYDNADDRTVLALCRHTEVLSGKLSDNVGMEFTFSYRGASHFRLGEHDASIEAYREYVGLMMKRGARNHEYSFAIEGVLRNCRATSDFSAFHSLRDDLYDHLRFISKDMKEIERFTMFDKDKVSLSSLLPEGKDIVPDRKWEEDEDLARTVMEILSGVALADGTLDASELHDLEESGVALAYRLGLNPRDIRKLAQGVAKDIDQMEPAARSAAIGSSLDALLEKRPEEGLLRAVYRLCKDMAEADGIVTEDESAVLDLIRTRILNS